MRKRTGLKNTSTIRLGLPSGQHVLRLLYLRGVTFQPLYLKCMVRYKMNQSPDLLMQTQLQTWINKYVSGILKALPT